MGFNSAFKGLNFLLVNKPTEKKSAKIPSGSLKCHFAPVRAKVPRFHRKYHISLENLPNVCQGFSNSQGIKYVSYSLF